MQRTHFITRGSLVATASALLLASPNAGVLSGGGGLAGNLGGNAGRGATQLGGNLTGEGRLAGNLPRPERAPAAEAATKATDAAQTAKGQVGTRTAEGKDKLGDKADSVRSSQPQAATGGEAGVSTRKADAAATGNGSAGREGAAAEGSARASTRR